LKLDGTRAETRFRLSPKRTSPFKSAWASVQLTAGSRGVRISVSNAGYATFRGSVRALATHSIRQFPLHFPSRASPCAIRFQTHSTITDLTYNFYIFIYCSPYPQILRKESITKVECECTRVTNKNRRQEIKSILNWRNA